MKTKIILAAIVSGTMLSFSSCEPKEEPKTIESITLDIKNDKEWFATVVKKAEELGISVDEALAIDAQYIFNLENGIEVVEEEAVAHEGPKTAEDFEALIRRDAAWMVEEEKKAKERGITIDEMLKIDAEYLLSEQEKEQKANTTVVIEP